MFDGLQTHQIGEEKPEESKYTRTLYRLEMVMQILSQFKVIKCCKDGLIKLISKKFQN
jgi:hypothetical protein